MTHSPQALTSLLNSSSLYPLLLRLRGGGLPCVGVCKSFQEHNLKLHPNAEKPQVVNEMTRLEFGIYHIRHSGKITIAMIENAM